MVRAFWVCALCLSASYPHLRSADPELLEAVRLASARSATFRDLVDRLNRSDLTVYVDVDRRPGRHLAGQTTFLGVTAGQRYVRITVDGKYGGRRRIGILAHELRHAVEIAEAPEVTSAAALAEFYRRIGFRSGADNEDQYESDAALQTGRQVEREVAATQHLADGQ